MPDDDRGRRLAVLTRVVSRRTSRARASAAGASYTLIGAIILLGGIGYAVDSWRGTSPWFLLGGLLLGIIVGFVRSGQDRLEEMKPVDVDGRGASVGSWLAASLVVVGMALRGVARA